VLRTPGVARLLVTDARGMPISADYVVRGPLGTDEQATPFDGRTADNGMARVEPLAKGRYTATLRTQQKALFDRRCRLTRQILSLLPPNLTVEGADAWRGRREPFRKPSRRGRVKIQGGRSRSFG
jgi:hypothetical protein